MTSILDDTDIHIARKSDGRKLQVFLNSHRTCLLRYLGRYVKSDESPTQNGYISNINTLQQREPWPHNQPQRARSSLGLRRLRAALKKAHPQHRCNHRWGRAKSEFGSNRTYVGVDKINSFEQAAQEVGQRMEEDPASITGEVRVSAVTFPTLCL